MFIQLWLVALISQDLSHKLHTVAWKPRGNYCALEQQVLLLRVQNWATCCPNAAVVVIIGLHT